MLVRWLVLATLHVAVTTLVIVIAVELGGRSSPGPVIGIGLAVMALPVAVAGLASGRASLVVVAGAVAVLPLLAVNPLTDRQQTLLSSAAWLTAGLLVAHAAVRRRPRSVASIAFVAIGSLACLVVHVRFVDPFRTLDCVPQCTPNPYAPSHHPAFGELARVLLIGAIVSWLAIEGRGARPRRQLLLAAAGGSGLVILGASNWTRVLTARTTADGVLLVIAAAGWVVVSADSVATDAKQVLLRRRVLAASRALGSEVEPPRVAELLGEALRDPHVRIAYPRPDGRHVDADGVDAAWPSTADPAPLQLTRAGDVVAVIDSEATDFVGELTPQLIIAIENEGLLARTRALLAELRESRERLVTQADEERHRLERDLHDGAQQRLLAISMLLTGDDTEVDRDGLEVARTEATNTLAELRRIARGLYPAVLDQLGLAAVLQSYLDEAPLAVELRVDVDGTLPNHVQRLAFRVVRTYCELVSRAGATIIAVKLLRHGADLVVSFEHDGGDAGDTVDIEDRVGAVGGRWTATTGAAEAVVPCG